MKRKRKKSTKRLKNLKRRNFKFSKTAFIIALLTVLVFLFSKFLARAEGGEQTESPQSYSLYSPLEIEKQSLLQQERILTDTTERVDAALLQAISMHSAIELPELEKALSLANSYLLAVLQPNGKFQYRENLNPDVRVPDKYNMLRHAGTIYALATHESEFGDGSNTPKIVQAANYLKNVSLRSAGEKGMQGIWSDPTITGSNSPEQIKLGGVGLSLVALLSVEKLEPGTTSLENLRSLGAFILYLQKPNGSFYSKYIPNRGGKSDEWTSLYYPGEAALGLVMLNEYDPQNKWLTGAARALDYLARSRIGKEEVEADHWALLATQRFLPASAQINLAAADKQRLIEHAIQVCGSMLASGSAHLSNPDQYGCFTFDGRTTPTATRLEGLQAGLSIIPPSYRKLRKRIETAVDLGIRFLAESQLKVGAKRGAITRGTRELKSGLASGALRTFNRRSTEIRIDYVQHPLSAFMQYHALTKAKI